MKSQKGSTKTKSSRKNLPQDGYRMQKNTRMGGRNLITLCDSNFSLLYGKPFNMSKNWFCNRGLSPITQHPRDEEKDKTSETVITDSRKVSSVVKQNATTVTATR
ncbi:unnamed protein product [Acanthoscelides obtectus]|uniref:Uncharacterized protein n=1 Tax=Acanthoscelides obtectus TaxID=200917 RepID=A0A9P0QAX6_ACAOB|nr:unnamed protein product [Acanthoscelides obtectus]CAK1623940.1 hypothetical protein AOBTE_LOCUS2243 [Acanthoscelides obtectus]